MPVGSGMQQQREYCTPMIRVACSADRMSDGVFCVLYCCYYCCFRLSTRVFPPMTHRKPSPDVFFRYYFIQHCTPVFERGPIRKLSENGTRKITSFGSIKIPGVQDGFETRKRSFSDQETVLYKTYYSSWHRQRFRSNVCMHISIYDRTFQLRSYACRGAVVQQS